MASDQTSAASLDLSVDEAAQLLSGQTEEGERDDEAGGGEPGEPGEDGTDGGDADPEGDDEQGLGRIRPPHSWDAEAKARFAELPEDVQVLISEREGERDRATSRALQDAAEARKRAEGEASEALQMTQALDALIPQAAQAFTSKWDGIDWQGWAAQDPQTAAQAMALFEAEQAQLEQLHHAQAEAEAIHHERYVAQEAARLPEVAPDLADPREGPARREAVAEFLLDLGATPEQLAGLSAEEAGLAYDALRWRRAQAGLASPSEPGQRPRTVRPTAAAAERSGPRSARDALAKLSRSGSVEDAVAYLRQRGR